jgi:hypothetical protein
MLRNLRQELKKLKKLFPLRKIRRVELVIINSEVDPHTRLKSFNPAIIFEYEIVIPKKLSLNPRSALIHEYFHIFLADRYNICFATGMGCSDREKELFKDSFFVTLVRSISDFVVDYYAAKLYKPYRELIKQELIEDIQLVEASQAMEESSGIKLLDPILNLQSFRNLLTTGILAVHGLVDESVADKVREQLVKDLSRHFKIIGSTVDDAVKALLVVLNEALHLVKEDPVKAYEFLVKTLAKKFLRIDIDFDYLVYVDSVSGKEERIRCIKHHRLSSGT